MSALLEAFGEILGAVKTQKLCNLSQGVTIFLDEPFCLLTRDETATSPITVKYLLTMTAGLGYNLYDPVIRTAMEEGKNSTHELVDEAMAMDLGYAPIWTAV